MQNIKTSFGFSHVQVGSVNVFTGKLRFKGIQYTPSTSLVSVNYTQKGYCIISYETTSYEIHQFLMQDLGKLAKTIAQTKLDGKYGWVNL